MRYLGGVPFYRVFKRVRGRRNNNTRKGGGGEGGGGHSKRGLIRVDNKNGIYMATEKCN